MLKPTQVRQSLIIPPEYAGQRLDQVLAELMSDYSRTRIKGWIESGEVKVDGATMRPKDRVVGSERIDVDAVIEAEDRVGPESIDLDIVHEDKHVFVINKPAGLVVHPGAGNAAGTLQNALLHRDPQLAEIPRAGIVHRLDKDTSGLLVVARSLKAHANLVTALEAHEIQREYEAVCTGVMTAGGTVDAPIDRHPTERVKMTVRESGRASVTHYRVIHRYRAHTHVRLILETGRTHQIRVHMSHIKYPLVGDRVYAGRLLLPKGATAELIDSLRTFPRQALHAAKLAFAHPITGKPVECAAPLPADMVELLAVLKRDVQAAAPAK